MDKDADIDAVVYNVERELELELVARVGIEGWQASSSRTGTNRLSYMMAEEPGDALEGLGRLDEDILGSERACLMREQ